MASLDFTAKVVLVDIEGTTTSISFVHDVLFPYAKENVEDYLKETWKTIETTQIVRDLQELPQYTEYSESVGAKAVEGDVQHVSNVVNYLIEKDLKVTPLKTLQGFIWAKGYASGDLKGHVYKDVPQAFQTWRKAGLRIAVYSSGSVAAQKLIFGHSIEGDLRPHLSAYFDTHVGHKQQTESYTNIAQSLEVDPQHVLFLTDVPGEAAAARAAGMLTVILQRPGNASLSEDQKTANVLVDDFTSLSSLKLP